VQVRAPAAVAHLVDYTLEVVRRVAGESLSTASCWEHLLAEVAPSCVRAGSWTSRELDRLPLSDRAWGERSELGGERSEPGGERSELGGESEAGPDTRRRPKRDTPPLDPFLVDAEIRRLVRSRQGRQVRIGRLLAEARAEDDATVLGYGSFAPYVRESLGISPRLARDLLWAHRRFAVLPLVEGAYREGRLSWAKTHLVLEIARPETQGAWLERARAVTTRYLEHEVARCRRLYEEDPDAALRGPLPLDPRPPGAADSPIRPGAGLWSEPESGAEADRDPPRQENSPFDPTSAERHPCVIRFWLPLDTYRLYHAVDSDLRDALEGRLEPWQRLFRILEHFLNTWDRTEREAYSSQHRILTRDGYVCAVPGCRARRGLEVHHLVFRSHGGSDRPENLITLCATHHRLVLHELGALRCAGAAHGQLEWLLGRTHYRGDLWQHSSLCQRTTSEAR
jgi:hypothetical protein